MALPWALQVLRLIRMKEAEATANGIEWLELAAEVDPNLDDPQGLLGTPYACHTAIINYMGPSQLFLLLCKVHTCTLTAPCHLHGQASQVKSS